MNTDYPQISYFEDKCSGMKVGEDKHVEIDEYFNVYLIREKDDKYTGWVYNVNGAYPAMSFIRISIEEFVKDCYKNYIMKNPCNDTYKDNSNMASCPYDDGLDADAPCEPSLSKNSEMANAIKDFIENQNPSEITVDNHDDYTEIKIFKSVVKLCEENLKLERDKAVVMAKSLIKEALRRNDIEDFMKSQTFKPPQDVADAAKRGLELREKYGRGGTAVGVARARDLMNRKNISYNTIKRMVSFFARHEGNKDTPPEKGNGGIAHKLWGGDAGKRWADSIHQKVQNAKKSKKNRCWDGYEPTPGKKPYSPGSCKPKKKKSSKI